MVSLVTVHIKKSIDKLGRTQRRAKKFIIGNNNVSCEDRLKCLTDMLSLERGRLPL